jgi:YD repeat-containing protein
MPKEGYMTKQNIRFEAPAHPTPRPTEAKAFAEGLRERPGEWALVGYRDKAGSARTYAYDIRRGLVSAFTPSGAYEAEMHTLGGQFRVYARFVGEVSS